MFPRPLKKGPTTRVSKYGKNENLQALTASYTFLTPYGFLVYINTLFSCVQVVPFLGCNGSSFYKWLIVSCSLAFYLIEFVTPTWIDIL